MPLAWQGDWFKQPGQISLQFELTQSCRNFQNEMDHAMIPLRLILAGFLVVLTGHNVRADIVYSWSGFVEPSGGSNPWLLSGDGSAATPTDGTPFTINVLLDQTAIDHDISNPGRAAFTPITVELSIGGILATVVSGADLSFQNDMFGGLIDDIFFSAQISLLGTTLHFPLDVRIPSTSFTLSILGVDPPPLFLTTTPVQFGGAVNGGNTLVTIPANAPVSSTIITAGSGGAQPVPEPSSLAMLGLVGVAGAIRRFRKWKSAV